MWPESSEQPKELKTGLTTGSCATACALMSARLLLNLSDDLKDQLVSITLPKGKVVEIPVIDLKLNKDTQSARATTIKDAGDDPDATHGAFLSVEVSLVDNMGVEFVAGKGVGTVTKTGLALDIGEPAINPVPRKMIIEHLMLIAKQAHYKNGFKVTVSIKDGETIALKTMNPRLGILGGLSILGTTGIVRPFSCAAYIASIHQGMDVGSANGVKHIGFATGNQSEQALKDRHQLAEMAIIEMGDFAGAGIKYLKHFSFEKITFCGGFGKFCKLAQGHLDLHSSKSKMDFEFLSEQMALLGASDLIIEKVKQANTSIEVLNLAIEHDLDLPAQIRLLVSETIKTRAKLPNMNLDVMLVNRKGQII
ncbi:cobalt-precorrin-5B (C(1))-methyltransferase [Marinicellulosiphila megalodicopiae]|uniref:cobalt-precorrin-5B (C(1))-methyltransferase n=1 Tax=Marinicellulosiphila megalodicopiae TaxID=2724896 RepID=UPI003BAE9799